MSVIIFINSILRGSDRNSDAWRWSVACSSAEVRASELNELWVCSRSGVLVTAAALSLSHQRFYFTNTHERARLSLWGSMKKEHLVLLSSSSVWLHVTDKSFTFSLSTWLPLQCSQIRFHLNDLWRFHLNKFKQYFCSGFVASASVFILCAAVFIFIDRNYWNTALCQRNWAAPRPIQLSDRMLLAADVTDGMLLAAVCRKKAFLLKDGGEVKSSQVASLPVQTFFWSFLWDTPEDRGCLRGQGVRYVTERLHNHRCTNVRQTGSDSRTQRQRNNRRSSVRRHMFECNPTLAISCPHQLFVAFLSSFSDYSICPDNLPDVSRGRQTDR